MAKRPAECDESLVGSRHLVERDPTVLPPQPSVQPVVKGDAVTHTAAGPQPVTVLASAPPPAVEQRVAMAGGILGELINVLPNGNRNLVRLSGMRMNAVSNELFDAELDSYLQGDFQYDLLDCWNYGPNYDPAS